MSNSVAAASLAGSRRTGFAKASDDLTIHYQVAGNGPQVVLLVPGWTMTSDVFERQLEHFESSTTHTLIAIDPRSHGLSTKTAEGNYYEQHGRDLDAFMRKLGLGNVVLGGWSNGGFAILSYVNQFGPGNLKGLIMLDAAPAGSGDDNAKEWVWFQRDDADGFRKGFTLGMLTNRECATDEFARWMAEDPTPQYMRWIIGITRQTGDGVAALLNESSGYQDYVADLKALEGKLPLLYFVRADWEGVVSEWARQHTPSASVVAVGKHIAFWERADAFNSTLGIFLTTLR